MATERIDGQDTYDVDILIIGGGPVGLYGAYYSGFRGLRTCVLDSLPELGGQITAMYPEKLIYDIAGLPAIRGRDLVDGLVRQAAPFTPTYLLGEQATTLTTRPDGDLEVTTREGRTIRSKAVIVTGGIGTFTPRPLPSAAGRAISGLHYFVPRPDEFADKDVVIVGGGDSAFDWALMLDDLARSITLVHRRSNFRAHQHSVNAVIASRTKVLTNSEVAHIWTTDTDGAIEAIDIHNVVSGRSARVPSQKVVAALGFIANLGPILNWGLALDSRHILVDSRMATSRGRVFAAGDITEYPGKVRLISVGFGEAATAVNNAAALINPDLTIFPGHSTDARS